MSAVRRWRIAAPLIAAALIWSGCRGGDRSGASAVNAPTHVGGTALPPITAAPLSPARWTFGHAPPPGLIARWNNDVNPAGVGLPAGSGTAAQGQAIFSARCAMCHGPNGEGIGPYPKLIQPASATDSFPFDRDYRVAKTIGNYWPYSTTVYEYISRAMPFNAPGSLTPDEVYAVTAYLLARNGVIADTTVMNARTLPAVRMPAHDRFVPDNRHGGPGFR